MWAITLTSWAVYLQLLKLLFPYVKIISSFKLLFKFISPVHSMSRRVQYIRICYMKGKIFKIKSAMVTKLTRHVPLLDSPVNFAEHEYSSLIVW